LGITDKKERKIEHENSYTRIVCRFIGLRSPVLSRSIFLGKRELLKSRFHEFFTLPLRTGGKQSDLGLRGGGTAYPKMLIRSIVLTIYPESEKERKGEYIPKRAQVA
jgi:hypothetical protein